MASNETSVSRFQTRDLTYSALFAVLMAVCAWIATPSTPISVPFTFQTFAVFAAFLMLGGRRGTLAVAVYLLLGLIGLPVFASFQGGAGVLLGATGGYIIGFLGAALLYWLMTDRLGEALPVTVCACLLGMAVYYTFGTIWFLAVYASTKGPIGLSAALAACVVPFIIPDLLKLGLAVLLSLRMKRFMK